MNKNTLRHVILSKPRHFFVQLLLKGVFFFSTERSVPMSQAVPASSDIFLGNIALWDMSAYLCMLTKAVLQETAS